ncbi:MAG: hypothetical protein JW909_07770 [Planctomycetes bacterium]|nr:hypothetical protein [Planctomycetota bacterium]
MPVPCRSVFYGAMFRLVVLSVVSVCGSGCLTAGLWDWAESRGNSRPVGIVRGNGGGDLFVFEYRKCHQMTDGYYAFFLPADWQDMPLRREDMMLPDHLWKGGVRHAALSPDGSKVAAALDLGRLAVWDASTGRLLHSFAFDKYYAKKPDHVAFSPDGARLVSCTEDRVHVYDVASGRICLDIEQPYASRPVFSHNGDMIAAGSRFGRGIVVWSAETGRKLHEFAADSACTQVAFSPDDRRILSNAYGRAPWSMWDISSGSLLYTLQVDLLHTNGRLAFDPAAVIALSRDGRTVYQSWDLESGKPVIVPTPAPAEPQASPRKRWERVLCFSAGRRFSVVKGYGDRGPVDLRIMDALDPSRPLVLKGTAGHTVGCLSGDGGTLLTWSWRGCVYLWDTSTGAVRYVLLGGPSAPVKPRGAYEKYLGSAGDLGPSDTTASLDGIALPIQEIIPGAVAPYGPLQPLQAVSGVPASAPSGCFILRRRMSCADDYGIREKLVDSVYLYNSRRDMWVLVKSMPAFEDRTHGLRKTVAAFATPVTGAVDAVLIPFYAVSIMGLGDMNFNVLY